MSDLIQIPPPGGPRSSRPLEALLRAQLLVEEWDDRRRWAARAIIAVSLPMAYFVVARGGLERAGVRPVFLIWVCAFVGWCVTSVAGAIARRMLDRLLASVGGRRLPPD